MSKMATNTEVNSKIGSSLSPGNKCPTKAEILATNKGKVSGEYLDNQLVDIESVNIKKLIDNNLGWMFIPMVTYTDVCLKAQFDVHSEIIVSTKIRWRDTYEHEYTTKHIFNFISRTESAPPYLSLQNFKRIVTGEMLASAPKEDYMYRYITNNI